jgi:hypothetical protein
VRRKSARSFEVRELMGGKSSIAFSYRIVGRRKDIKGHRRFAKIDTRLPRPAARARPPSSTLDAFIANLKNEARAKATAAMRKRDKGLRGRASLHSRSSSSSSAWPFAGEEIAHSASAARIRDELMKALCRSGLARPTAPAARATESRARTQSTRQ